MANVLQFIIDIQSRQNGVIRQVQQVQDKVDAADRSVQRLGGRFSGLKSALMSLPGAQFFTNPIVAMGAGTGIIAKMGMDADKTAVSFNVLTGSMEEGSRLLGVLNKYADDTIYERLGTQEAAKTMLGFGVSLEHVADDLKMLGDVAMGDKQRMSQLALVFGQVAAAGKLQGQDLLQLINAGYNPLLDISAMTGKSVGELRDEMSKGNISFEMLRQAFRRATSEGGKFHNMTNEIAKTPYGRWQQLLGEFNSKLLEMYRIIQPALIPAMDGLSTIMSMATPVIQAVGTGIGWVRDNIDWLMTVLIPYASAWAVYNGYMFVSTSILKGWTVAQWAQVTALIAAEKAQKLLNLAMWKNPVFWVTGAVALLATTIMTCWNKFAGFRAAIKAVGDAFRDLGGVIASFLMARLRGVLSGMGRIASAMGKLLKGEFRAAWSEASQGAKELVGLNDLKNLAQGVWQVADDDLSGRYYKHRLITEQWDDHRANTGQTSSVSIPGAAPDWAAWKTPYPSPYRPESPITTAWEAQREGSPAGRLQQTATDRTVRQTVETVKPIAVPLMLDNKQWEPETPWKQWTPPGKPQQDSNPLSVPKAAAGTSGQQKAAAQEVPTDNRGKGSEQAVTGGTRNTQITMHIGKFFDSLNVTMADRTDTREIQRIILESINRSLEIASSAAR